MNVEILMDIQCLLKHCHHNIIDAIIGRNKWLDYWQ